ncbi:MAG: enoyl-CoA hydratase-related protein, partial [Candidatus Eremiobacterota bacterium]
PLASVFLPRLIAPARAWEMILTGRPVSGEEALHLGLVNRVCDPEDFDRHLEEFVQPLLQLSPAVHGFTRRALRMGDDWEERLSQVEALYTGELMSHPDAMEGLQAFLGKRPPRW